MGEIIAAAGGLLMLAVLVTAVWLFALYGGGYVLPHWFWICGAASVTVLAVGLAVGAIEERF